MRAVTIAIIIVVIDAVGAVGAGAGAAVAACDIAIAVRLEIESNGNAIPGLNAFFAILMGTKESAHECWLLWTTNHRMPYNKIANDPDNEFWVLLSY